MFKRKKTLQQEKDYLLERLDALIANRAADLVDHNLFLRQFDALAISLNSIDSRIVEENQEARSQELQKQIKIYIQDKKKQEAILNSNRSTATIAH